VKPIKLYGRSAPSWFTPYHIDMDIKEPYNIHVWMVCYMWMFVSYVLFFYRNDSRGAYNTIGGYIPR